MALFGTFIAGRYTGSLNSVDIGLTKEGYKLRWQYMSDDIDKTDGYGDTTIEQFYMGTNVWLSGIFMEYKAGVLNSVSPWQTFAPTGANTFGIGIISRAASAVGTQLILTVVANTPAGTGAAPTSITMPLVIQDKGFNVEPNFGPTHRETPFMFRVLPSIPSSTALFFTTT